MVHALDSVNAVKLVSVMEWHCCLGYIVVESICKLMECSTVVRIKLDLSS